jgi:hypothetical protein
VTPETFEERKERVLTKHRDEFSYLCIDPGDSNPSFFHRKRGLIVFGHPVSALSPWNLAMLILELERNSEALKFINRILHPFRNPGMAPRALGETDEEYYGRTK